MATITGAQAYEASITGDRIAIKQLLTNENIIQLTATGEYRDTLFPLLLGTLRHSDKAEAFPAPFAIQYEVHVISLPDSKRLWRFAKEYNLSVPFQVFEGINALSSEFNPLQYPELNGHAPTPTMEKHAGCTLSHIYLWRKLLNSDSDYFLIFEEDSICTPYAYQAFNKMMAALPNDADLIYVNGRSSQKLMASMRWENTAWENLPDKEIYSRAECLAIQKDNFSKLQKGKNGKYSGFSGTDGYLLTRRGLEKLVHLMDTKGMGDRGCGAGHNVDSLLAAVTSKVRDHSGEHMIYDYKRQVKNGYIRNSPLLNGYLLTHPIVETQTRIGLEDKKELSTLHLFASDIQPIKKAAKSLSSSNPSLSKQLQLLVRKLSGVN